MKSILINTKSKIKIMSKYPSGNVSIFQYETKSGMLCTGWINDAYANFKQKSSYPIKFVIKVNLLDFINDEIAMDEIEDFFDIKLKNIGTAHFLARYVTDLGLNMIFYTGENKEFEDELSELQKKNKLNIHFEIIKYRDPKWKTVNAKSEGIQSIEETKLIIDQTPEMIEQWKKSGLNTNEKFEIFISFYSSNKFEAEGFVRSLQSKGLETTLKTTRTLIILKGYEINVYREELWEEESLKKFLSKIAIIGNQFLCRIENIGARVKV